MNKPYLTTEQLTGRDPSHLIEVEINHKQALIHQQVAQDLLALTQAAQQAGFDLALASGYRSYQQQAHIWNEKFNGRRAILDDQSNPIDLAQLGDDEKIKAIMRWSALPAASRHHWGCDFDVYARNLIPENQKLQLEPWEYDNGHQFSFNQWLTDALEQYGFFRPYQEDRGGVAIEPWHISHCHLGTQCLSALSLDTLVESWQVEPFSGLQHVISNKDKLYQKFITNIHLP